MRLGGLNKTPDGVVIGLVQLQLPTIAAKSDLVAQTKKICAMVQKARKSMPTMDLVVFLEYSLHGLSMDTNPDLMSRLDGPEVAIPASLYRQPHLGLLLHHEVREASKFNDLTPGLGKEAVTEFQSVSAMAPKPVPQQF